MDRKKVLKKKLSYQIKAKFFLIIGLFMGILMVIYGSMQLYFYHKERGNLSTDALNQQINEIEKEANEISAKKEQEYSENGSSDRYFELMNEYSNKMSEKMSVEKKIYMDKTGYHNPRNIFEYIVKVPFLFIGLIFVVAGIVAHSRIRKHGRNDLRRARIAAAKQNEGGGLKGEE